ncbi:uncharacterized protein LOC121976483 isoform X1 [Zingiber officinale]|uniref:uncharacterized protein LOC121976483 isoform X1 n=1 Tax=Zingiber officinale TaxID=94328 RepID=UPI001C4CAB5F|nr:uncharacterized protein LOC121976483 isoform X1 [Zingiber officinale]XP_042384591.1 uncharacterized protein LOC121976483 isoform X1 [Zingiber officinale]XP_042384592.1 uncharacterized protein LOC121976483 isoform X1 [Zingiber officinale]XP_042384593.1 uncharacterized protein LOC121976483 isoform X1 [Zingiber officinale]
MFFSIDERFYQVLQTSIVDCNHKCVHDIYCSSDEESVSSIALAITYWQEWKNSSLIRRVLLLSLFGPRVGTRLISYCYRVGGRLILECSKCLCVYARKICAEMQCFLFSVQRTLLGSSLDIGWLQRTNQLPIVEDGTTRFMELLHDVRNGVHCLPNNLVYLLIPGLFSNHGSLYFVNTKRCFSKMGLTCHIAKIHSEASVEKNSWELKQYIEELCWGSGKRVMLLGHSKGGVDAAAALSIYWSDLSDKVAGLALVQSPYGGCPIASDILREGQVAGQEARRIMEFIICKIIKGDMRSLEDLTYEKRKDFISKHTLPLGQIPLISFHTEASIAPGVLATMSHIAHAELPWLLPLPPFLRWFESENFGGKVPVILPASAAMAITALHMKLRYGEPSDGLVARCDAEVPGSVVVRLEKKLDHSWMVYSSLNKDHLEPDASEMCEALLTMLVEIGTTKKMQGDQVENSMI